ncbi:MAG: membrane protein of unknown function [Promethearchaeota archaeon]|nr:MAG: membrane protein of unknown function [Candidatus Lokiarchaeota archaeon]
MIFQISTINLVQGFTAIVMVIVALVIGARISLKYREAKQRAFLGLGIGWFLLTSPWWSEVVTLIFQEFLGIPVPEGFAVILSTVLIPATLVIWAYASSLLIQGKKMQFAFYGVCIYAVIFQITLFVAYFTDYTLLATRPNVGLRTTDLLAIFLILTLLIFVSLGLIFSIKATRVGTPETKYKGYFLVMAFILFLIGSALDSILSWEGLPIIVPILVRTIQISSSVLFYLGYFLPKPLLKKLTSTD